MNSRKSSLEINTILISGANSQIGSHLAHTYEAEGKKLLLLYHQHDQRIKDLHSPKIALDLCDAEALARALEDYQKDIDCLIHCAAVRSEDHLPLADTSPATFRQVFEANVYPAYNLLRMLLPGMRGRQFGRIVLFSSDVSRFGLPNGSAYAAAKAAIANLAKSASRENAANNVLINSIAPGPVETAMDEDFNEAYLDFRTAYFANHILHSASGKLVSIDEIKVLSDMLISPQMRNLCGEEILINGGKK